MYVLCNVDVHDRFASFNINDFTMSMISAARQLKYVTSCLQILHAIPHMFGHFVLCDTCVLLVLFVYSARELELHITSLADRTRLDDYVHWH